MVRRAIAEVSAKTRGGGGEAPGVDRSDDAASKSACDTKRSSGHREPKPKYVPMRHGTTAFRYTGIGGTFLQPAGTPRTTETLETGGPNRSFYQRLLRPAPSRPHPASGAGPLARRPADSGVEFGRQCSARKGAGPSAGAGDRTGGIGHGARGGRCGYPVR